MLAIYTTVFRVYFLINTWNIFLNTAVQDVFVPRDSNKIIYPRTKIGRKVVMLVLSGLDVGLKFSIARYVAIVCFISAQIGQCHGCPHGCGTGDAAGAKTGHCSIDGQCDFRQHNCKYCIVSRLGTYMLYIHIGKCLKRPKMA